MINVSAKLLATIATVLVACLAVIAAYSGKEVATVATGSLEPNVVLGAGSTFVTEETTFAGDIVVGGKLIASTTVATETLSPSDIKGVSVLNARAAAATTMTLPTKATFSSFGFLPNAGDSQSFSVHATGSIITIAGNTGVALRAVASSSKIYDGRTGTITLVRLPAIEGGTIDATLLNDN